MTAKSVEELTVVEVEAARRAIEYYFEKGWTDGLPIVPPIEEFVAEFLAQTSRSPEDVLITLEHLKRTCNVRQAAINAVMAGCRPEYFPVVIATLESFQGAGGALIQSTTGQAQLIIVNGPARERLGFNSRENILGPGDRANVTVGRTLRLVIMNVLGVRPHEFDQSTQGTPLKFGTCIAENEEESPWEPLHVEKGFAANESTVTMQAVRSDLHVEHRSTQVPEEILLTIADTMSYAGGIYEAPPYNRNNGCVVVIGPEHANIIAAKGWSKQDVRRFLFEHYGRRKADLRRFGKIIGLDAEPEDAFVAHTRSPESITIVVAGAANAGVSTVCPNFGGRSATKAIAEPKR